MHSAEQTPADNAASAVDAIVAAFARRLMWTMLLGYGLALTAAFGFAWGLGVLIGRVAGLPRTVFLYGLIGWPAAFAGAWWLARRRMPHTEQLYALVDSTNQCGGLLMTSRGHASPAWQARLPVLRSPTLDWRGHRLWSAVGMAAAFLTLAMLVPTHGAETHKANRMDVSGPAAKLHDQIDTLEREKIIKHDRASDMRKKLKQIGQDARGDQPERTWDALDHLTRQAKAAGERAGHKAVAQAGQLARARALSRALESEHQLSAKQRAVAMSSLAHDAQLAAKENAAAAKGLSKQLREALKDGKLSRAQLGQLGKALTAGVEKLDEQLSELREKGLLSEQTLAECRRAGESGDKGSGEGLAKYLKAHAGQMAVDEAVASWMEGGRGGRTRGGGPSRMTFNDEPASSHGIKLQPKVLPPGGIDPVRTKLVGLSAANPTVNKKAKPSTGNALDNAHGNGGSANKQPILPRYRGTVRRYFNRDQKGD